ncbi:MAG: SDR family NAD(P)-dependent oxidoreductase [Clostridiales bacterium]|nr:SDR family NAD(P)-dependent oxidoreductase [Clostridiales bacterium]
MKEIAVITGASSGIGEAFVKEICASDETLDEIWIIARRSDKLDALVALTGDRRLRPVKADLTDPEDLESLGTRLSSGDYRVALLINCAGLGKRGNVENNELEDIAATINVNCQSLTLLTKIVLPFMKTSEEKKKGGRIINIASSAAFLPQPGFAVYSASKSYVLNFSRALGAELAPKGIVVTAVCPGPVATEFLGKATNGRETEFSGIRKNVVADAGKLAEASLKASYRGRKILVYKFSQKLFHFASKALPTSLILHFEQKLLKN